MRHNVNRHIVDEVHKCFYCGHCNFSYSIYTATAWVACVLSTLCCKFSLPKIAIYFENESRMFCEYNFAKRSPHTIEITGLLQKVKEQEL